jgi:hypothetical protein
MIKSIEVSFRLLLEARMVQPQTAAGTAWQRAAARTNTREIDDWWQRISDHNASLAIPVLCRSTATESVTTSPRLSLLTYKREASASGGSSDGKCLVLRVAAADKTPR